MKALARSYVWWPAIDSDIETIVKACSGCASVSRDSPEIYQSWMEPDEPWQRIHMDFAGPFHSFMWLLYVDAKSKYPGVIKMKLTTSAKLIFEMKKLFSLFGLPKTLVTDNGPQFVSSEFENFCKNNGIYHMKSAPYHPQSNGIAERFVQTFKKSIGAMQADSGNIDEKVEEFLQKYRATPNNSGKSPAEMFFGRKIRTKLDLLMPDDGPHSKLSECCDTQDPKYKMGECVWVRYYFGDQRWKPGKILKSLGSMMYEVQVHSETVRRHQKQLRKRAVIMENQEHPRTPNDFPSSQSVLQNDRPRRIIRRPRRYDDEF